MGRRERRVESRTWGALPLLCQLTITTDGAVRLHYHVWDGNTADDQTHIATWDVLCQIAGGPGFLYVGDCKVCTAPTMKHIDRKKGRFLTVMPRTRKEDRDFRQWLKVDVRVIQNEDFRQEKRGRPGPHTRYRKIVRGRFGIDWQVDAEAVRLEARTDGIFPLITNDRKLTIQKLLLAYKRQSQVEQRFDGLKNAHDVAPQYLKRIWRIEALLCCYFLALLVDALLERQLRRSMKRARLKELPLYPEGRECKHPTTERVIELFKVEVGKSRSGCCKSAGRP